MNEQVNKPVSLESFCRGLEDIIELNAKLTGEAVSDEMRKKLAIWKTGLFRIVIMGECKKGKSSFINALLGEKDLSPVCSDIATSTIYKICYGSKVAYRVFFTVASKKSPLEITKEDVSKYGTEKGNPGNREQVDFIQVTCPSPLLKAGLVIIDTPGLGGLFKQHKLITYQYVPKSDAVFLVTDSIGSPIGKAEIELLTDLGKVTKHVYFVQTKAKQVDTDTALARKDNNINILKNLKIDSLKFSEANLHYFVVDSERKQFADETKDAKVLERSGFPEVASFLTQYIQPNVARLVMERALAECRHLVNSARITIANKLRNLETEDATLRAKMVAEINEMQRNLEKWENDTLPDCKQVFDSRMLKIDRESAARYEKLSPQGDLYREIEGKLQSATSIDELDMMVQELNGKLPGHFAEVAMDTSRFIRDEIISALNAFMSACGMKEDVSDSVQVTDVITKEYTASITRKPVKQQLIVNIVRCVSGGGIGFTVGAYIGGILGGFVVPGAGNVAGAALGGKIGAFLGAVGMANSAIRQNLEMAKTQICNKIASWMLVEKQKMSTDSSRQMSDIMLKVNLCIKKATTAYRAEMTRQLQELVAVGKKDTTARQPELAEIRGFEIRLNADLSLMGV